MKWGDKRFACVAIAKQHPGNAIQKFLEIKNDYMIHICYDIRVSIQVPVTGERRVRKDNRDRDLLDRPSDRQRPRPAAFNMEFLNLCYAMHDGGGGGDVAASSRAGGRARVQRELPRTGTDRGERVSDSAS